MKIRKARQILRTFADDTRLRIINLLYTHDLAVNEICILLNKQQPNISKHLMRLRLTGIVGDKRDGTNVIYYLSNPTEKAHKELINLIINGFSEIDVFKFDNEKLEKLYHKNL